MTELICCNLRQYCPIGKPYGAGRDPAGAPCRTLRLSQKRSPFEASAIDEADREIRRDRSEQ